MSMQNRRTTLGPLSMDSEANRARLSMLGGSGIAGVSSSSSSSSSRQSLMIKQPQRLSIAPGASSNAAAGNGRLSIAPGRQSMAFDPSRRQSTFGAQVGRPKDPRPIRDKSFQHQCVHTVISFLIQAGYPNTVSSKVLSAPSLKDFQNIFLFLYRYLDPGYAPSPTAKFEDEVPVLVRGLSYPFYGEINKSQLQAVGSPHAWPVLLAMLTWMVDLILAEDREKHEAEQEPINGEMLFFSYLSKAYVQWLAGNDSFELLAKDLSDNFDKKNSALNNELGALSNKNNTLRSKIAAMDAEQPPVPVIEERNKLLENDVVKLNEFLTMINDKIKKREDASVRMQQELAAFTNEVASHEKVALDLKNQVESQPISIAEAHKLRSDQAALADALNAATLAKDQSTQQMWDKEMALARRLQTVDQKVQRQNQLSDKLHLTQHVTLTENIQQAQVHLRSSIRPTLAKLADDVANKSHQLEANYLTLQERMGEFDEALAAMEAEIKDHQRTLAQLESRMAAEKATYSEESAAMTSQVADLEKHILEFSQVNGAAVLAQMQSKIAKLRIDYENAVQFSAEEHERYSKNILSALNMLVNFKSNVEQTLSELQVEVVSVVP